MAKHTQVIGKKYINMKLPFKENKLKNTFIRTFDQNIDEGELVWHRDREDRIVKPLTETDWMVQIDNELPKPLTEEVFIPKGVYHRVIKGSGDLKIELTKLEEGELDWIKDQNPQPWEEFMFPYIDLKPKLENTRFGDRLVYRDKNGEWIFFHGQNPKNGCVWFNYNKIWFVFETKFGFNYREIQELLKGWLGEHHNLRGVTTFYAISARINTLGEDYNLRGVTTHETILLF